MSASAASTVVNAAQKASTFANNTVETARFDVLKEPLGFIKIVQFFMALLAFAIAVNGASNLIFTVNCVPTSTTATGTTQQPGYTQYSSSYSYPYNLNGVNFQPIDNGGCTQSQRRPLDRNVITNESNNIVSSAQFFVFVGVMAFIYAIAFFVVYVFFRHKYNNIVYFPLFDFAFTALWALFWFCSSVAWAKAITDIQNYTDPNSIISSLPACKNWTCAANMAPTYANIIVSCILGFGNWILWSGDVWFVLKETGWYKARKQLQQQQQNVTNNPISPNDINITAHYNPNNRI